MLAAIEGKMEELFEELENLPAEKVEAAEKVYAHASHIVNLCVKCRKLNMC